MHPLRGPDHFLLGDKNEVVSFRNVQSIPIQHATFCKKMILSLESAEILLIDQNLITRDELEDLKRRQMFGTKNCKALNRFKKAVKKDYKPFFPEKPCNRSFARTADRLFRSGFDKIEAEKKKAGEKRRYQENNSTISPRKKLPKRKTANKSS
jgi:hypothetical protein